jgi:hypothetical protein
MAQDLVGLATNAVRCVESGSQLQQLFDESGRDESWHAATRSLRERLEAISAT